MTVCICLLLKKATIGLDPSDFDFVAFFVFFAIKNKNV